MNTRMYEGTISNSVAISKGLIRECASQAIIWAHWSLVIVGLLTSIAFVRVNFLQENLELHTPETPRIASKK